MNWFNGSDSIEMLSRRSRSHHTDRIFAGAESWKEGIASLNRVLPVPHLIGRWRIAVMAFFLFFVGLVIVGRLFHLQVVRGQEYYVLSERNRVYTRPVFAPRGVIFDRNGEILARNAPAFSVGMIYAEVSAVEQQVKDHLQRILILSGEEIDEVFAIAQAQPQQQLIIKRNITHEQQIGLKAIESNLPGITIIQDSIREYPLGEEFAVVLGYTGVLSPAELTDDRFKGYVRESWVGKSGLESEYESYLQGQPGWSLVEVEASGKTVRETILVEPEAGQDIHLSLDVEVQKKLSEYIQKGIERTEAWAGSAMVMNVKTGEVLGLVSLPTYDNNDFYRPEADLDQILNDPRGRLVNRVVNGVYSPGSTIKMAVGAWALEKGEIRPNTLISGTPQVMRVGEWEFPDWTHSWGRAPHGNMTVVDAIANSSDIFFYKLGGGFPTECKISAAQACEIDGIGVNGVVESLRIFGFGREVGIDLPDEAVGLLPDPAWKKEVRGEDWFLGNTYHLSIGQGDLLATPLQVIQISNTIASDEKTSRPHLILNDVIILNRDLDQVDSKPVSLENLQVVRQGMVEAVTKGIIYSLRGARVPVAAKTGTAEFGTLNAKGEYETHAWVTGFAPIEDPQLAFVFMLESGGQSSNAADVAREFVDWYFSK